MKISVITPSVRPEGLEIVARALQKQTFIDFEWIICTPNPLFDGGGPKPWAKDKYRWIQDDFKGGFWSLNRVYNKLFKEAKGKILVSWQDWIFAAPDALQKFVDKVEETNGIVSGVGDQYEKIGKFGKPEVKIWNDPRKRKDLGDFYEVYPNDIEWNFAAFPKKAVFDVGGMDQELDFRGFGGDQLQIMERIDTVGYKSYLDQTNESFTIRHDRSKHGGQKNWDSKHVLFNGEYDKRKKELTDVGEWPILSYLK